VAITLVQAVVSAASNNVSFGSPTTAGNCVVVGFTDESGATSVTGVTLGGSADNFAQLVSAEGAPFSGTVLAVLWADPNCAGGQTAISVTASGSSNPTVWAAEFSGIVTSSPLDKQTGTVGGAASWSSGSTATTSQAVELWVGAFCNAASSGGSGPSSPWNNTNVSDSGGDRMIYGYDIVSSTGAAAYSGSGGSSKGWAAVVATLKGAGTSPTVSPFGPPKAARGKPATVRGTGRGERGAAYVAFPSKFTPPRKPAKGAPGATRGHSEASPGAKYVHVIPPGPSPFYLPTRPAKGATAVRGTGRGEQGAAYVDFPSPFVLPKHPARGAAAAVRGRGLGHPGAQYVLIQTSPLVLPKAPARGRPAVPFTGRGRQEPGAQYVLIQTSPFYPPHGPAKGASATRRGSGSGSITGKGSPAVPRQLILSFASQAGTDDYGNTFPQGIYATTGVIEGPRFIAYGAAGEYLVYSSVPAAGDLVGSVAATAGTDDYGNAYLAGFTNYGSSGGTYTATNLSSGQFNAYTATSPAGPWSLEGSLAFDPTSGWLSVTSAPLDCQDSLFVSGGSFSVTNSRPASFTGTVTIDGQLLSIPKASGGSASNDTYDVSFSSYGWNNTIYSGTGWASGERAALYGNWTTLTDAYNTLRDNYSTLLSQYNSLISALRSAGVIT
jgi:hypothetical protein